MVHGLMTNWKESVIFIVSMHVAGKKLSKLMIPNSYPATDVLIIPQQKINALAASKNWSEVQEWVVHLLLLQIMMENQITQIQPQVKVVDTNSIGDIFMFHYICQ